MFCPPEDSVSPDLVVKATSPPCDRVSRAGKDARARSARARRPVINGFKG